MRAALDLIRLPAADRRLAVQAFAARHTFPHFDLAEASGLYALLRLIFDLPHTLPRDDARTFGGWLHPSISAAGPFEISWPVTMDPETGRLSVARFEGYAGKGYDALAEYDYFASRFPLRDVAALERLLTPAR